MELTILIPCLNEEKTIGQVIDEANMFLTKNNIDGEVLVVDNGSSDDSIDIVTKKGAKVVNIQNRGYGQALIGGTNVASGKYVIMGDADFSYNLYDIMPILEKLREGNDLVIGNRLNSKMEKGAMPLLHKYVGTPIISTIGNVMYNVGVKDFNSGLRGYDKDKIKKISFSSTGFEYATEMLIKAKKNNLKIAEVDICFRKDKRNRKPHLKPVSDGVRHMRVLIDNVSKSSNM